MAVIPKDFPFSQFGAGTMSRASINRFLYEPEVAFLLGKIPGAYSKCAFNLM